MTPEQEDEVRRALAAEPPAAPMPPEVAARLEDTLAGLVAERTADTGDDHGAGAAPVATRDDLATARTRRRRVPQLLVAAAGVAVLGIGVGTVFQNLSGQDGDSATSAGVTADDGGAEAANEYPVEPSPNLARSSQPPNLGSDAAGELPGPFLALDPGTTVLRSDRLADDVARVLAGPRARSALEGEALVPDPTSRGPEAGDAAELVSRCTLPAAGPRDLVVAVRLDGTRGTLVVRGASEGTRVAEVYACDDVDRLLAVTEVDPR